MTAEPPLAIVLGTRPEIIKMAPIVRACRQQEVPFYILHTGQHYSYSMDQAFFEDLGIPGAKYNLEVGSGAPGAQTGRMLERIESVLVKERPRAVLVQGDTNTVLAGGMAASKQEIPVGHVEAGLRSFDRSMPEETNRVLVDHLADALFAPTDASAANLRREGIPDARIHVTGNTVVDAVHQHQELAAKRSDVLQRLHLGNEPFALLTMHRKENVDDATRFRSALEGAAKVHDQTGWHIVYPIHPRARKRLEEFDIPTEGLKLVDPLGYLDFLYLQSRAQVIMTDSGGVQEEACILRTPCVTLRENTERPETLEGGANRLAGTDPDRIATAVLEATQSTAHSWKNPFGDGKASERILAIAETLEFETTKELEMTS